jgi:ATP-dependent RNA helicase RhlE
MPFSKLGLYSSLVRGAQALGYTEPTPIQAQAIPAVLSGRDLIASAQTGTGKTAAFALPILNRLGPHRASGPRVLVLEPTRELAAQVDDSFHALGKFTDFKSIVLHGGVTLGPQRNALRAGVDVIVATTGRLREFLDGTLINLSSIEVLVLDEVDRMLDMGFIEDVKAIVKLCPVKRQTLLFSATIPPKLEEVAKFALNNPQRIEIARARPVTESVNHVIHPVTENQKLDLLYALLKRDDFKSVIVFTRTRKGADRVAHQLRLENQACVVIHAERTQGQRVDALDKFKTGRVGVLVATDIAARGIDVAGVSHVINFDVPLHAEDYVHRIGRTGRAAATGDAVTLVTPQEANEIVAIEKLIGQTIPVIPVEGFAYEGGAAPRVDPANPLANSPKRAGHQQSLGKGGKQKGDAGNNQDKTYRGKAFGGGNPLWHSKGKPGAHWRDRKGR